jgi:ATP-binding cassette subfamily B protein
MGDQLRALRFVLSISVRTDRRLAFLSLAETLGKAFEAARALFIGLLVVAAAQLDLSMFVINATCLLVSVGANLLLEAIGTASRIELMERLGFEYDQRLSALIGGLPTLDHLDRPELQDRLQLVRDEEGALGGAFNSLAVTMNMIGYAISAVVVAATVEPRLLLICLLGVPRILATRVSNRWAEAAEEQTAAPGRLAGKLIELTTSPSAGAEARVLGFQGELSRRIRAAMVAWRAPRDRLAVRQSALDTLLTALFFGGAGAVLIWIMADVVDRRASVTAIVVGVTMMGTLQLVSTSVSIAIRSVSRAIRNASRFLVIEDYAARLDDEHDGHRPAPDRLQRGIVLTDVSLRYPGTQRAALQGLSVELPAGAVIALVGENGSGKSSLVKLLTGLYRPTNGRIEIDGIDIVDMSLSSWRSRTAASFQDPAKVEYSAAEYVGLGDIPSMGDRAVVTRAVEDGGAEELIASLPNQLDTQLGTSWPGGIDLSGGQWQRLSLARSQMREDPLLLVLDEPTSALDATTEHQVFQRQVRAARRVSAANAITILVTHRFSTVRDADLIIVLHAGKITEIGDHDTLVANSGHYAQLYEAQAQGYR